MHEDIKEHLPFLTRICLELEASFILELGVRLGGSTKAFLKAAEVLNAKVVSIDIEDCSLISDSRCWKFLQMNDLDYTPTEKIDVLFIDTDHTYRQTLNELVRFAPWVRDNGVIILHDTEHCPEVKKAINTFLNTCLDKYTFENRENNNGLGILWQRQASSYLVG